MNWHKALDDIYAKLEENGFEDLSKEIFAEQLKGGTGGEIFDLVLTKLLTIKRQSPKIYALIKVEVDGMVEFAKSIGYL